jgi:crotonobetainyl-CoA:carnitine CoA-transferase CaiB-like acyl-CoA transferase
LKRLALSYDDFRAVNPDIVFCQALGFPTDGDRADDPAYDDVIQSECGLADAYRRAQGSPQLCPTILADKVCGMAIANAVVIGVLHKYRTGRGQRIEVPMIDVMRAFLMIEHGAEGVSDPQGGSPGYLRILNSQRGPQKTKDGWITILPYSAEAFDAIFRAGGRHDLVGDQRTRGRGPMIHAEFLYAQLRPIVAERTTGDWMAFCREERIPVGAVADLAEILNDYPVVQHPIFGAHRLIPSPVRFSLTPAQVRRSAPMLGEHTTEILFGAGLTAAELVDLTACGIVHCRNAETPEVA